MASGALTRERDVREAYAAHAAELYGFAVRSLADPGLADEAVQETFLRAWRAGAAKEQGVPAYVVFHDATLRQIAADRTSKFIAGGTNLLDLMKDHIEQPSRLIDISQLPLKSVDATDEGGLRIGALVRNTAGGIAATIAVILVPGIVALLPSPWNGRIGRFTLLEAARQVSALHPAADLFSPGWSLLVLLAWPAAGLAAAALVITRRDA